MTTDEMKKRLKRVIDKLESLHEELSEYGQQPIGTGQAAFTFYLHDGEAERSANDIFSER